MLMSERPLVVDVSVYQTYIDLERAKSAGNEVLGVIMRARVGLLEDVDYHAFDEYYDWEVLHRASYHAIHPDYDMLTQVNGWLETDPTGVYMVDAELHKGLPAQEVANAIIFESDTMLERTGRRPLMYGAYYFLEDFLMPFVSVEWVNEHWWVLASYGDGDADEDDGYSIMIPDKIHVDRVAFQQTTSTASLYAGGEHVDRDRFLLGEDAEDLAIWWEAYIKEAYPEEPDPVDPELEQRVTVLEQENEDQQTEIDNLDSKTTGLRTDLEDTTTLANDNHRRIGITRSDLTELEERVVNTESKLTQLERAIGANSTSIAGLAKGIEDLTLALGELEQFTKDEFKRVDLKNSAQDVQINAIKTRLSIWEFLRELFGKDKEE